jgi:hypothetical protein
MNPRAMHTSDDDEKTLSNYHGKPILHIAMNDSAPQAAWAFALAGILKLNLVV